MNTQSEVEPKQRTIAADAFGILALSISCIAFVFLIYAFLFPYLPLLYAAVGVFLLLAIMGLITWHRWNYSESVAGWVRLIAGSVFVGGLFFGSDLLWGFVNRRPNILPLDFGLLGIWLTILVCPVFTMICVGGLVRTIYLNKIHAIKGIKTYKW